MVTWDFWFLQV